MKKSKNQTPAARRGISIYPKPLASGQIRHVVEINRPDTRRERRTFHSIHEAHAYADTLTEQLARIGRDGLKLPTSIDLHDAIDQWLSELRAYAADARKPEAEREQVKKYLYKSKSRAKLWQAHTLANKPLRDITRADLCDFIDDRREEDRADQTIRADLYLLNALYQHARAGTVPGGPRGWSWDLENPIKSACQHRRLQQSRQRDRRPTRDECALIEEAFRQLREGQLAREAEDSHEPIVVTIPGHPPLSVIGFAGLRYAEAAWHAAIQTAMRRGKMFEMRTSWIDWKNGNAVIPVQLRGPENKRVPSHVPLSPRLRAILRELWPEDQHSQDQPLFGELTADNAGRQLARICEHLGIDDLRWHDLRHEACSRLAERGWTTHQIQRVSGHKTLQSLQRYTHISTASIHALWEREEQPKPPQEPSPGTRTSRRNRGPVNVNTKKSVFASFRVARQKTPQQNHSITSTEGA